MANNLLLSFCFIVGLALNRVTGFNTLFAPLSGLKGLKGSQSIRDIRYETKCQAARREILGRIGFSCISFFPTFPSFAESDADLKSQLFNEDGSPREGVEVAAKERLVEFEWEVSDQLIKHVDGVNLGNASSGPRVKISYKYPFKWSDGKDGDLLYFDRSEGTNEKACKRIVVYQAPGKVEKSRLEKATTLGVAKALNVPEELNRLFTADTISGRTTYRNGQKYYEYDMASAPETCGDSRENLGLGFCPYDDIFLLSATVLNDRLYVVSVECDSTRIWKLASSDLKRVRSSFTVEEV